MILTDEIKKQIDGMSYESMLSKWRFAPAGDPLFQGGPVFDYFEKSMKEKREKVGDAGCVMASKSIGW